MYIYIFFLNEFIYEACRVVFLVPSMWCFVSAIWCCYPAWTAPCGINKVVNFTICTDLGSSLTQKTDQPQLTSGRWVTQGAHAVLWNHVHVCSELQQQADHFLMAQMSLDAEDRSVVQHLRTIVNIRSTQHQQTAHLQTNQTSFTIHKPKQHPICSIWTALTLCISLWNNASSCV